jgi:lysozyme family protein
MATAIQQEMQQAEAALQRTINALNVRRRATTDPAEKAALLAQVEELDDRLDGLAHMNLEAASLAVEQAADKVADLLRTASVNPFDRAVDSTYRALCEAAVDLADQASRTYAVHAPRALDRASDDDDVDVTAPAPAAPRTGPSPAVAQAPGTLPPIVTGKTLAAMMDDYRQCWAACRIHDDRRPAVAKAADRLLRGKERYQAVSAHIDVPWQLIGIIHGLECGYDFNKHLHNGDSLAAPTHRVPPGRPPNWQPGSPWEDSAVDALQFEKLDRVDDWSLPRVLYVLESFNGFGYRGKGIRSPYLWSFSNLYTKGKYVADHVYDPNVVSEQVGSALVLKVLEERGLWP